MIIKRIFKWGNPPSKTKSNLLSVSICKFVVTNKSSSGGNKRKKNPFKTKQKYTSQEKYNMLSTKSSVIFSLKRILMRSLRGFPNRTSHWPHCFQGGGGRELEKLLQFKSYQSGIYFWQSV